MAAHQTSSENERDALLAHFRRESGHLIYSKAPGGEGRMVSEDEAVHFVAEFMLLAERHARRFGRSVWASVLLLVVFFIIGAMSGIRLFTGLALLSIFGWWFTAIAQRIVRARFKYRVWDALEQRAPVRALTRHEKIARGYALSVWQWLGIGVALAVSVALGAPPRALPPEWRDLQMLAIAAVMFATFLALLVYGAFRLVRRLRGRG